MKIRVPSQTLLIFYWKIHIFVPNFIQAKKFRNKVNTFFTFHVFRDGPPPVWLCLRYRTSSHKQHIERMKEISHRGNRICFDRYAFQEWRQTKTRIACRNGKIWVHIFLDKFVIVWPTETCMSSKKDLLNIG